MGHFASAHVPPARELHEFRVSPDALIPAGTRLFATHFLAGQFVDVTGTTKGKGFAGGMKRWGFHGLRATHGVSVSHRSIGSTGCRQDPGRVFKNKKMPGHMGHERRTMRNLLVYRVFPDLNVILLVGCLPGPKGSVLYLRDATWKSFKRVPPFPTHDPAKQPETTALADRQVAFFPRPYYESLGE